MESFKSGSKNTLVINQYAAHGDIMFIEPICRHLWEKNGAKPILPVRDHLMWFTDYIESAQFVPMSKFKLDYDSIEIENPDYLPLRFANQIVRNLDKNDHHDYENTMPDKYILAGLPIEKWKELKIKFNEEKAYGLFRELGLTLCDKYILVNEYSQAGNININPETDLKIVKMREIKGYTVLDWCMVMAMAQENHHISTSTFYILEALKYSGKVFMYPRPGPDGLKGISKLNPSFKYISAI